MLKGHLVGLLNFVLFPITNAVAEGTNTCNKRARETIRIRTT